MTTDTETFTPLSQQRPYVLRMGLFLVVVALILAIPGPRLSESFFANPGLNGLIVGVLVVGCIHAFRQVLLLRSEIGWVNSFRWGRTEAATGPTPQLLAPMASLLSGQQEGFVLSALSLRFLLDSVAARLDEARDISRYMIGLLIFLGLLGTFWGLLETVSSVGQTIRSVNVGGGDAAVAFEDLRTGLQAPLAGMGTAFSSSLFGLGGSLILGFLDLQANQAQSRFYNELEEWLSTSTRLAAAEAPGSAPVAAPGSGTPSALAQDQLRVLDDIRHLLAVEEGARASAQRALTQVADRIAELTRHVAALMQKPPQS